MKKAVAKTMEFSSEIDNPLFLSYVESAMRGMDIKIVSFKSLLLAVFPASAIVIREGEADKDEKDFLLSLRLKTLLAPTSMRLSLPGYKASQRSLMIATPESFRKKERDKRLKVLRNIDDFKQLFALYRKIAEMDGCFDADEDDENAARFLNQSYPFAAVALVENGRALSAAYISRAESTLPMITAVATEPGERKKGYATSVVSELMDISFNENRIKKLALWCLDKEAEGIYRALGFEEDSKWIHFKEE